jgi:hypothetical protein
MTNNQTHLDKTNYDDVYLRCVILGFLGFLRNRFSWINTREDGGDYEVKLPIYYSLTGDNRYIMDAFYDDIPDKRVNMNTDQIPRGVITLKSWAVKQDEFTNPNIWYNVPQVVDDELVQIVTQTKAVPVKLTFTLDTILDSEIDVFKSWQTYMDNLWIYKYFSYDYKMVNINAIFNFVGDTENVLVRDYKFGDTEVLKTSYTFEVHTFYPIFDYRNKFMANDQAQFILSIWQSGQNTNLPPISGGIQ